MIDRFKRAYCSWLHHLGIYDDAFLFWLPWGLTIMILGAWWLVKFG
jgi:hypothetical protein